MFTAALSTIAQTWKQLKYISRGTDKQKVVHTYRGMYSALSKEGNYDAASATVWLDLQDIMLSEISQTPKDRYCRILIL